MKWLLNPNSYNTLNKKNSSEEGAEKQHFYSAFLRKHRLLRLLLDILAQITEREKAEREI